MKRETVGVVVARFQVPELTVGHKALLKHVANSNDKLAVVLGTRPFPDERNPLTFEMRRDMLIVHSSDYPQPYVILQNPDRPGDNDAWSKSLDQLLRLVFPTEDIKLYGGRDGFSAAYTGTLKVHLFQHVYEPPGTQVRLDITSASPINSRDFRAGVIYAVTNYVKPDTTDGQLQTNSLETVSAWDDHSVELPRKPRR